QVLPTLSHVYTTLSFVLCEWNDIETALYYSKEAVSLARRWEQADALHFALDSLGQALFASGDVEGAYDVLRQTWKVARNTSTWFEEITMSQEVEWHLALGDMEKAIHCFRRAKINIEEASQLPLESFKSLLVPAAIVQIYLAQQQYSKALTLIGPLAEHLERRGVISYLVRVLIWRALAYRGLNQEAQALASLKQALILSAPEGYLRSFIKSGSGLIPLLKQARLAKITPDYVDNLLAAFEAGGGNRPSLNVVTSRLVEPLSEREMDVLRLLAQGCSDKKIAENLVIARETVHKHLKNIYGKMDVHSRSEAIARAHELDLL
ncbi:MAG TPA: LuxR C-terminal-related transcriptional regulator, partial [Anaerolineales bacterium]